jgi:hypothetical protein
VDATSNTVKGGYVLKVLSQYRQSTIFLDLGYFLSVLDGTFLESLAEGRYATGAVTDQTLHA